MLAVFSLDTRYSLLDTKKMDYKITSAKHYEETMIAIFEMQEQEEPLTAAQIKEMELMLKAAEKYEEEEL